MRFDRVIRGFTRPYRIPWVRLMNLASAFCAYGRVMLQPSNEALAMSRRNAPCSSSSFKQFEAMNCAASGGSELCSIWRQQDVFELRLVQEDVYFFLQLGPFVVAHIHRIARKRCPLRRYSNSGKPEQRLLSKTGRQQVIHEKRISRQLRTCDATRNYLIRLASIDCTPFSNISILTTTFVSSLTNSISSPS